MVTVQTNKQTNKQTNRRTDKQLPLNLSVPQVGLYHLDPRHKLEHFLHVTLVVSSFVEQRMSTVLVDHLTQGTKSQKLSDLHQIFFYQL